MNNNIQWTNIKIHLLKQNSNSELVLWQKFWPLSAKSMEFSHDLSLIQHVYIIVPNMI